MKVYVLKMTVRGNTEARGKPFCHEYYLDFFYEKSTWLCFTQYILCDREVPVRAKFYGYWEVKKNAERMLKMFHDYFGTHLDVKIAELDKKDLSRLVQICRG